MVAEVVCWIQGAATISLPMEEIPCSQSASSTTLWKNTLIQMFRFNFGDEASLRPSDGLKRMPS